MKLLCIFLVVFFRFSLSIDNESQDTDLLTLCDQDIRDLCPRESRFWVFLCLLENQNQLSGPCAEYIGTTTVGGCNNDAQSLCPDHTSIIDLTSCLQDHYSTLTNECRNNLNNNLNNPWLDLKEKTKHATQVITMLGLVFLSVPIIFSIWASIMTWFLQMDENKVLLEISNNSYQNIGKPDDSRSIQGCELSFLDLSYWTEDQRAGLFSCLNNPISKATSTTQILNGVSGRLSPSSLSAIMGPSGSGKSTLLRLLAGQTENGTFSGQRLYNGSDCGGSAGFDCCMRAQAYVPQMDVFLESLTVWQSLVFSALLRISEDIPVLDKVRRAATVLKDLGLESAAHCQICGGDAGGGISGGQRRRLSIAQELLSNPQILMLDEPTSGLDSATSLSLVQALKTLSRSRHSTIVLTIHQPRSEAFLLFDSLILLGTGGRLVYSGPLSSAAPLLSSVLSDIPSLPPSLRPLDSYDNPGDFILDLMGSGMSSGQQLQEETQIGKERSSGPMRGAVKSLTRLGGRLRRSIQPSRKKINIQNDLESNKETELVPLAPFRDPPSDDPQETQSLISDSLSTDRPAPKNPHLTPSEITELLSQSFLSTPSYLTLRDSILRSAVANPPNSVLPFTAPFLTQLWVIFGRKLFSSLPTTREFSWFFGQILLVSIVVLVTFSYPVDSQIEAPYQVLMILFMLSTYAFILQYLTLLPEYERERPLLSMEAGRGIVGYSAYIFASMLTEVPRAIGECVILLSLIYLLHPLNPNPINKLFSLVCLCVGVGAWQSLLSLCASFSDSSPFAYSLSFLALGSGTLFGGFLVRMRKIPLIFKPFYFLSVTSVTQRALLVNDLQCCYLSLTCNSIAKEAREMSSHPPVDEPHRLLSHSQISPGNSTPPLDLAQYCPPGLQFTGDGSDEGNLGRAYLKLLGLEKDMPFASLFVLFWASILFRLAAILILKWRHRLKYQLKHRSNSREDEK